MATLNTACGWTNTDPGDILLALDIGITRYSMTEIVVCMNDLCDFAPHTIAPIQDLISEYDAAQTSMITLNNESSGKTLVKADVLEWEAAAPGSTYSPERELLRIRDRLMLYFAACPVCGGSGYISGGTSLIRS